MLYFYFAGLTGDIVLDENADREARYWLWQVADGTNKYQHLATVIPTVSHNSSVSNIAIATVHRSGVNDNDLLLKN